MWVPIGTTLGTTPGRSPGIDTTSLFLINGGEGGGGLNIEGRMQVVVQEGDCLGVFAMQLNSHIEITFKHVIKMGSQVEELNNDYCQLGTLYSKLRVRFNALQGDVGTLNQQFMVFGETLSNGVNIEIESYQKQNTNFALPFILCRLDLMN